MLSSRVLIIFKGRYSQPIELTALANAEIDFYCHTYFADPIKQWRHVGTLPVPDTTQLLFKDVNYEKEDGPPSEGPSKHWRIWHLDGELKNVKAKDKQLNFAELGGALSPRAVERRIFEGKYGITYYGATY